MKVQFIYTFEVGEQIITDYMEFFVDFLESKNTFLSYAMTHLDKKQQGTLVKISCCVIPDKKNTLCPEWYNNCRGKFWMDDLDEWRYRNGVKTKVDIDYRREWYRDQEIEMKVP